MEAAPLLAVPYNILICVPAGLLFYELDNRFIGRIKQIKAKLQQQYA